MSKEKQTLAKKTNHPKPVYLDCNATTPMEPAVRQAVLLFLDDEYGNEGSRTHGYGAIAKQAVQAARDQIAELAGCQRDEVIFTSGATEANNLVILGIREFGERTGRKHIISSQIEHKAVLEPLEELIRHGFEVDFLPPNVGGWIDPALLKASLRPDTLLVTIMHANNETGVIQPVSEFADVLRSHESYLHIDAAQTFGKLIEPLRHPRIDFVSASAHKIYGPKGVGALVTRRRGYNRAPLRPLLFGGGQERGLRPGTLPVPLIVGFGLACEIARKDHSRRNKMCSAFRKELESALMPLAPRIHGDPDRILPHVINLSFPNLDSEAVMVALKGQIAISNGSACTSASYQPSHVLKAMKLPYEEIMGALRISWCHMTPEVDWHSVSQRIQAIRS